MQTQTKLYLKQFMNNFIEASNHKNILNLLFSSLEVLENMVDTFMHEQDVFKQGEEISEIGSASTRERGKESKSAKQIGNEVKYLENSLETGFQRLYGKVKCVLEWAQQNCNSQCSQIPRSISNRSLPCNDDDELYQILNQYKSTNKTLKQQLQCSSQKLEQKVGQLFEQKTKNQTLKKEISYLSLRISQLQSQLQQNSQTLTSQITSNKKLQQSTKKLQTQLTKMQQLMQKKEQKIQEIKNREQKKQEERKRMERERDCVLRDKNSLEINVRKLRDQFQNQIKKKLADMPEIVQKKVREEKSWNAAVVQHLRKFAATSQSIHKQNFNTNPVLSLQNFKK